MIARMSFKSARHLRLTERELDRHNREYHGFRPHWNQPRRTSISLHVRLRFLLALVAAVLFWLVAK